LNLLNDPTYVEAARFLAQRMISEGGNGIESRLAHGFRLITARIPRGAEMTILKASLERNVREFRADPASATSFLKVGEATASATLDVAELAAYTALASTMLNLDEVVMKE
jgi:hypothetical protein